MSTVKRQQDSCISKCFSDLISLFESGILCKCLQFADTGGLNIYKHWGSSMLQGKQCIGLTHRMGDTPFIGESARRCSTSVPSCRFQDTTFAPCMLTWRKHMQAHAWSPSPHHTMPRWHYMPAQACLPHFTGGHLVGLAMTMVC